MIWQKSVSLHSTKMKKRVIVDCIRQNIGAKNGIGMSPKKAVGFGKA